MDTLYFDTIRDFFKMSQSRANCTDYRFSKAEMGQFDASGIEGLKELVSKLNMKNHINNYRNRHAVV